MRRLILLFLAPALLLACTSETPTTETTDGPKLKEGRWRIALNLGEEDLPFNFDLSITDTQYSLEIINSSERIKAEDVAVRNDSVFIEMPVFNSAFIGVISSDSSFSGFWHNYARDNDYKIPFEATHSDFRFAFDKGATGANVAGNWETDFSPNTEDNYKAIGQFQQYGVHLTGTFVTETGDYRFLEGTMVNNEFNLSCFDGSHAFLFKAVLNDSNQLEGNFWSGTHWKEPWVAQLNNDFTLRHPDSLTYLKEGYDRLAFTFPDLDSNMVSLSDEKYNNKVVIAQIMGSWCPNCMDESTMYSELYSKYNTSGLEIIGLAYEKTATFEQAKKNVLKMKGHLNCNYDFLIASTSPSKQKASESLPMLNHIMSYPTSIFIDKKGEIRKIHTGFYGPGTGHYYDDYKRDIMAFIEMLLNE